MITDRVHCIQLVFPSVFNKKQQTYWNKQQPKQNGTNKNKWEKIAEARQTIT